MAGPIVTGAFSDLLKLNNVLDDVFFTNLKEQQPFFEKIFNMPPIIAKKAVDDKTIAGFDVFTEKAENANITFDEILDGYRTRYLMIALASGFQVSHEMQQDEQYKIVKRLPFKLAEAAPRSVDTIAADIFNNGGSLNTKFLATGVRGDNLSLFNTAHTLKGGGTYSNDAATPADISVTSLQINLTAFKKQVGDQNELLDIDPKIILVPTDAWFDAQEIIGSPDRPDTAERAKNILNGMGLQVMEWKRLTDADTWYILSGKEQHKLKFRWREKPITSGWKHERTMAYLWRSYLRFSVGHSDWRGLRRIQGQ
jgi:hypothetical protein